MLKGKSKYSSWTPGGHPCYPLLTTLVFGGLGPAASATGSTGLIQGSKVKPLIEAPMLRSDLCCGGFVLAAFCVPFG